jgi:hypothetical protein
MSKTERLAFIIAALLFWYIFLYANPKEDTQAQMMNFCMWLNDPTEREMCLADAELNRWADKDLYGK